MDDPAPPQPRQRSKPKAAFVNDPGATLESLIRLSHRFATSLTEAEVFSRHLLSVAEWSLLGAVKQNPGRGVGRLARASGISRQRTRQLLNALAAAGLVEVTRAEQDRRGRTVALTGQGEAALAAVRHDLAAAAGALMDEPAQRLVRRAERLIRKLGLKLVPRVAKTAADLPAPH